MKKLIVNVGSMFSGKTTALIQQGERYLIAKKKVIYIKPSIDNRYSKDEIITHKGTKVKAVNSNTKYLSCSLEGYDVILIDEIQFFDKGIVKDIENLIRSGKTVVVSGLDMDYLGNPFETTMYLMGIADVVNKFKAICEFCGEDATYSHRICKSNEQILLGEKESYIPLCRNCYDKEIES